MPGKPALFLDRDGVIIVEVNYLATIEQVQLIPGAVAAIQRANQAGRPVVVVTNQAGVARGYYPESRVGEVHEYLNGILAEAGARVDGYYYCPHHPVHGVGEYKIACGCRKPAPGMLHAAARDLNLDLARSWLIGDRLTDLEAGAAVGCRTVLVKTGYGATEPVPADTTPLNLAGIEDDVAAAVDLLFRTERN